MLFSLFQIWDKNAIINYPYRYLVKITIIYMWLYPVCKLVSIGYNLNMKHYIWKQTLKMLNLSSLKCIFYVLVEKLSLIKFISIYVQNIKSKTVLLFKMYDHSRHSDWLRLLSQKKSSFMLRCNIHYMRLIYNSFGNPCHNACHVWNDFLVFPCIKGLQIPNYPWPLVLIYVIVMHSLI